MNLIINYGILIGKRFIRQIHRKGQTTGMEKKVIIIYKSSTGFTKRYAEMIAEEINGTLADFQTVTAETLSGYDTVVFGSRAHAGMIDGYKKAKELFQKASVCQWILFVTGATPNTEVDVLEEFWKNNLTEEERKKTPHFYMQSGLCYEKMSLLDKGMMKFMVSMMKKKKDKNDYEKGMERSIASSFDISSKEYIMPLVSLLRQEGASENGRKE